MPYTLKTMGLLACLLDVELMSFLTFGGTELAFYRLWLRTTLTETQVSSLLTSHQESRHIEIPLFVNGFIEDLA